MFQKISFLQFVLVLLITCYYSALGQSSKDAFAGFAVVELFTSQGCHSCPPADKILSEIIAGARKSKKPVYAISYHVDYWNKLGWKDPYSSKSFTLRQNNYVSALGGKEVYTPQVFVNGKIAFVGSDPSRLNSEIEKALKSPAKVSLAITKDSLLRDTLFVSYTSSKSDKNFSLVFSVVQRGVVTKVGKGENSGKTLTHDNVVRAFEIIPLSALNGNAKIPVKGLSLSSSFSLYSYVQQKQTKEILGVTGWDF